MYSLFQFPSSELVVSLPCSIALFFSAACIILLSGLKSAVKVSRVSPLEVLNHTKEIYARSSVPTNDSHKKEIKHVGNWLAGKSCMRFRVRNRPIRIILVVTFMLCFVLNGFQVYATEVIKMTYDSMSYNYAVDLYSNEKKEVYELANCLIEKSGGKLRLLCEANFDLNSPYPFSTFGESHLQLNGGRQPDVSLLCIDKESFHKICEELAISNVESDIWGIFLNTERSWWSNGVKVVGTPFELNVGDVISLYGSSERSGSEEISMDIVGVYESVPLYTETTEETSMQILVSDEVFAKLETRRPYMDLEPGAYHIALRGNMEDSNTLEEELEFCASMAPNTVYYVSDYIEIIRQEGSVVDSFEFLSEVFIGLSVFMCICGNFTISWSINKTREREFATYLSIGMKPVDVQKMRLLEMLHNMRLAFIPGVLAGLCSYQLIYWSYSTEYQLKWQFPILGLLLGMAVLVLSIGITDFAHSIGGGKMPLSERLRVEPI